MLRSHFTFTGLLLAMLLMVHAAMLAGGGHSAEAHEAPMYMNHGGMVMSDSEALPAPVRDDLPRVEMPAMIECGLLGIAALRVEIMLDAAPAEALISTLITAIDRPAVYAPFVSAFSRSQLQVFLI
ncbi:MAG: hypothetical protein ACRDHN_03730 [Thermomicrobiales bacterium]